MKTQLIQDGPHDGRPVNAEVSPQVTSCVRRW